MECSRDSGNCWEKDLPRSQATGSSGGAWLPAERVPLAPQGAAVGGPAARPGRAAHPRGIPGCGAGPAHLSRSRSHGRSMAAVTASPGVARGGSKEREVPSRSFPASPGLRAGGSDAESVRPFRHPGGFELRPFASLPPPPASGLSVSSRWGCSFSAKGGRQPGRAFRSGRREET